MIFKGSMSADCSLLGRLKTSKSNNKSKVLQKYDYYKEPGNNAPSSLTDIQRGQRGKSLKESQARMEVEEAPKIITRQGAP